MLSTMLNICVINYKLPFQKYIFQESSSISRYMFLEFSFPENMFPNFMLHYYLFYFVSRGFNTRFALQSKTQYLHFSLHMNYFLFTWKISGEIS